MKHAYLKDFIYGAIDGTVTTFAVVAGVAGADLSMGIVLILGAANLVGDGFSIGVSSFLAARTERDIYLKQQIPRMVHLSPIRSGLSTFSAFLIAGLVPLVPFIFKWLSPHTVFDAFYWSAVATGIGFFIIGALKAPFIHRKWFVSGLQTFLMGAIAASLAYFVGMWLRNLSSI
ncbi:MAG TPA: VIT1/CCC1 transporter family protein [Rhabdochlamydiaceae bacterium]|nr:VIT1/CCC1 transporter family protein [Rhabdochlamydiaceae bacterium]